jgi:predicted MPP superfamily phosphohydrolase
MSLSRLLFFLVIVGGIVFALHYYVWVRLVRDPALPAPWRSVGGWAIAGLGTFAMAATVLSRFVPRSVSSPFMWFVYVWIGVVFFAVILLAGGDLVRGVFQVGRHIAGAPADPARRLAVARLLGGGVGVAALGLAAGGMANALRELAVKRVKVPMAKLPAAASGYRIVQVTDIHVGPTIGKGFIEEMVARINDLEPDLVAITGDLVDGSVEDLGPLCAPLAQLRAKDGVFFVTGNHEYYSGASEWVAFLPSLGIKVLRNERVSIRGEHGFDLAGVDDWTARGQAPGHGPDLPKALEGRDVTRALVLLAHQPKAIVEAAERGVDLVLSGHTHGGQFIPWNFAVRLQQPYVAGLHTHGTAQIYVSEGTGYWGPPMRVGTRAEITEIELIAG